MPTDPQQLENKDEITLTSSSYLLETSKGEILYRRGDKYWEQREQAIKVAEHWTTQHACYVHLYRMVGKFPRWVGSWVGGKQVRMNQMGF